MATPAITYTPNGAPRAPGYYNPDNPYDTGYHGQQNVELNHGHSGNKLAGWDYQNARPINGSYQLDANGLYTGLSAGSGGGGSAIPGAAIYAQIAAQAKLAYQNALARLNQQRGSFLRSAGYSASIDPNTGVITNLGVDVHNPFGQYQTIRQSHAQQDMAAQMAAEDRGLSTAGGLGKQLQHMARAGFGQDDLQFGQGMQDQLLNFQDQQDQAKYAMDQALWQAELAQLQASDGGGYGYSDPGSYGDDGSAWLGGGPGQITGSQNLSQVKFKALGKAFQQKLPANAFKPAPKPAPKKTQPAKSGTLHTHK